MNERVDQPTDPPTSNAYRVLYDQTVTNERVFFYRPWSMDEDARDAAKAGVVVVVVRVELG